MNAPSEEMILDRCLGAVVGLAVGDAIGTTLEGSNRGPVDTPRGMIGGGPHNLEAGEWTDDTAMALCLLDSLVAKGPRVDQSDLMRRFAKWMQHGDNSCNGRAFDIGWTTKGSIFEFLTTGDPVSGPTGRDGAGNGGIMRLAPAVVANRHDVDAAARAARRQSETTHGAPQCIEGADLLARILQHLIVAGEMTSFPVSGDRGRTYRELDVVALADGSYRHRDRGEIRSTGYVVDTLGAALWSHHVSDDFESAVTNAVNLGGDTDTVGAVTGQIAGAAYGLSGIPVRWLERLAWREEIEMRVRTLVDVTPRPRPHGFATRIASLLRSG